MTRAKHADVVFKNLYLQHVKDKKLKGMLKKHQKQAESAATRAARAEALLSEAPG